MKLRIITDSTSEISQQEAAELGIIVIPLHVEIEGRDFIDGVTITNKEFFSYLRVAKKLPRTSAINPAAFIEAFSSVPDDEPILAILLSSDLSTTYQSAIIAKAEVQRQNITLYDSRQATLGLCALVKAAVQFRNQGDDIETIVAKLEEIGSRMVLEAAFNDLKYLAMGGRMPKAVAMVGSWINLRPIITMSHGKIHLASATIGIGRAMGHMVKRLVDTDVDETLPHFIAHSDAPDIFDKFKRLIAAAKPGFPTDNPNFVGITVGSHAGPGCVGLVYFKK
ncbi:MAG: DegV family protein [Bacilli bacterium]|jgi:DegV family protein with EDD domain